MLLRRQASAAARGGGGGRLLLRRVATSSALTTSPPDAAATDRAAASPSQAYSALVARGALTHDGAQADVVRKHLDRLHRQLHGYSLPDLSLLAASASTEGEGSSSEGAKSEGSSNEVESGGPETPPPRVLVPRGLYLHGSVGTGKSMLMDLFFAHVAVPRKRRVHFNKFMLEVHARIQQHKQAQLARFGRQRHIDLDPRRDVIAVVADQIADDSHVLCFDEFQVTDIADALIMRKLFGVFFSRGVVVVATSNTPPEVRREALPLST